MGGCFLGKAKWCSCFRIYTTPRLSSDVEREPVEGHGTCFLYFLSFFVHFATKNGSMRSTAMFNKLINLRIFCEMVKFKKIRMKLYNFFNHMNFQWYICLWNLQKMDSYICYFKIWNEFIFFINKVNFILMEHNINNVTKYQSLLISKFGFDFLW